MDGGKDARTTWEAARKTDKVARLIDTLQTMTGVRARCMYCEDSRGTDVDHFYPIVPYRDKTFIWPNMLLNCTDCGRHKTNEFPVDAGGEPLLIDPTSEDPWLSLFYDTRTGNLAARFDPRTGQPMPRGEKTLEALGETLLCEAVVEGRRRTHRNLVRAVRAFLNAPDGAGPRNELVEAVRDNDAHGLTRWYLVRDGRDEAPFAELRARYPEVWVDLEGMLRG